MRLTISIFIAIKFDLELSVITVIHYIINDENPSSLAPIFIGGLLKNRNSEFIYHVWRGDETA